MSSAPPLQRLRSVDWRFLLRVTERPRILDLTRGGSRPDLAAVGETVGSAESPDLAVLGFPRRTSLRQAGEALGAEGQILSTWRLPRPWGVRRARRHLQRNGFADVRFYRPGPDPGTPARWAPLQPVPREPVDPPPASPRAAVLRRLRGWLGPVYAIAERPAEPAGEDPLQAALPGVSAWVLLTGGSDEAAKAVGLPLGADGRRLPMVAKFGRGEAAERGLRREAGLLEQLGADRPNLPGVPRLRARGHRAGCFSIVQDAATGKPFNASLDAATFAALAPKVTSWLLELAGDSQPAPAASWAPRLVEEPLTEIEERLGGSLGPDFAARARAVLHGLGELPLVWEHRDFGPWNVLVGEGGSLHVIDWEDAEPQGLPGLDLAYFLVSAAASLQAGGDGEQARYRQALQQLADASAEPGRTAAACMETYCRAIGIGDEDFRRLRLLCWLAQARVAVRRSPHGQPLDADAELFAALALDELEELERQR